MKSHRALLISIGIVAVLFVAVITYGILNDETSYSTHSGLGSSISLSPDDATLAFSYYENGKEAIYLGSLEDGEVRKVTEPAEQDHRMPQFSPVGEGFLYLAANSVGVQSLHHKTGETGESIKLTGTEVHVSDAAFSPDGSTIYYMAIPAEDFLKPEGEKENGADLFSVNAEGGDFLKLTDKDSFAMDDLTVSGDGTTLYYTEFDGVQRLIAYSIEEGMESAYLPQYISNDLYHPDFFNDEGLLAYTAVSEESKNNGSLYEYELFLMETSSGETKRLTDFNASVASPTFFHHENRIAFLMQPNWPSQPEDYEAMTVDYSSGETSSVSLDFPEPNTEFRPSALAHWLANPITVTGLYLLLFGLLTVYCQSALKKRYLPVKVSAVLTGIILAGSFAVAVFDPWPAIGLFALAAGLAVCTGIILVFAYSYRRSEKTMNEI
ncbi:hypothetical protein [uncultured Planococcus sp.]|uniref:TolB family protein n=1 Tax=uncultured Planococcus sp. TaxID=337815 RepID=UPI002635B5F3|nr:hypothetical protein [uncultured Planococcus sp.]